MAERIDRIEVNLLPAEYRFRKSSLRISRPLFYAALGILIIWTALLYYSVTATMRISQVSEEIKILDQSVDKNRPIKSEILKLKASRETIREKIRALQRISVNKEKWVRLLETISKELPEATWVTSIIENTTDSSDVLHIEGQSYSFNDVANFMTRLSNSNYIASVDLQFIEQRNTNSKAFEYLIDCAINRDAQLEIITDGVVKKSTSVNGRN